MDSSYNKSFLKKKILGILKEPTFTAVIVTCAVPLITIIGIVISIKMKYNNYSGYTNFSYYKQAVSYGYLLSFWIFISTLYFIAFLGFILCNLLSIKDFKNDERIHYAFLGFIILLVGYIFYIDYNQKQEIDKWQTQEDLLRRSIQIKDINMANETFESLLATAYPEINKNNICNTKQELVPDTFIFAANIFNLEGNQAQELNCLERAANNIQNSSLKEKLYYAKYIIYLEEKDYAKAYSAYIESQKYKHGEWEFTKIQNITKKAEELIYERVKNKDTKTASEILELLLTQIYPNKGYAISNICTSEKKLHPELLTFTGDIFALQDLHNGAKVCFENAKHNLRYNLEKNPFSSKITMDKILKKLQKSAASI